MDQDTKNTKIIEFWTIYQNYGTNSALEWLEYNKYYEYIHNNDMDNLHP